MALSRHRAVDTKELSDMIAAPLARTKRERSGFVAMCLLALAIMVGFAIILLMAR
jgi:uncharacterized membrane protein YcjF (UPF0283 family)